VTTNLDANAITPEDMELGRAWMGPLLMAAEALPVSFVYASQQVRGIPAAWAPQAQTRRLGATLSETVWTGADSHSGLQVRVECLAYHDAPVVEWTAWLTNTGSAPTPLITDLRALDATFAGAGAVLTQCNGDFNSAAGYTPQETPLPPGATVTCAPTGGRACDGTFPYLRLRFATAGLTLAIGWPGQWTASFTGTAEGVVITAAQEHTHLRLLPGEAIRTPRITLLSWTGDTQRAINLWRRWYRAHVLPRPHGQPLQPTLSAAATDEGEEFTGATEENQIRYMDRWKAAGFAYDVWWIDAGWYPCANARQERQWTLTGTWEADPARFPRGLGPVGEHAARNGAALLLWFEPERVAPGTQLFEQHPEWLLRVPPSEERGSPWSLLNLGNPACRRWLTAHVSGLITAYGVGVYRQDFKFPPLRYWQEHDAPERQGVTENLHVQGYLQFWDDLLARHPGLWIDSCASGGRRNDLETLRRSVPLHYTDYGYGNHAVKLAFHHTLYAWIPYFRATTLSWDVDTPEDVTGAGKPNDSFAFHCGMAPMLTPALDIRKDDNDLVVARTMVSLWRRAVSFLLNGDYYALTPFSKSPERWVAWQFDMPVKGEGLLQGIRLAACPDETLTIHPQRLAAEADYVLDNPETGENRELSGSDLLRNGFTFMLPPRSGAIWFYRQKQG